MGFYGAGDGRFWRREKCILLFGWGPTFGLYLGGKSTGGKYRCAGFCISGQRRIPFKPLLPCGFFASGRAIYACRDCEGNAGECPMCSFRSGGRRRQGGGRDVGKTWCGENRLTKRFLG